MLLRHAIGEVVRRRRLERHKTLQQLSAEARVSLPYISEIERGLKEASSEILQTLCLALDVSLQSLVLEASDLLEADAVPAAIIELQSVRTERSSMRPGTSTDAVLLAA